MTAGITTAVHSVDAATVMALLPSRPLLLALGEPTHGEDDLLDVRNDLFRQLVEQEGYRTITIESDCLMGLIVDDYVTSGKGDSNGNGGGNGKGHGNGGLDDVMARGFSHGWGAYAGNRELVRWMRAYNDGRPAAEQVRFAGFDGPLEMTGAASPRQALAPLHDYLTARVDAGLLPCTAETLDRLLGADERWTDPGAMRDPSRSVGQTPDAERLRLVADDLVALLDEQAPHLRATSSREDWDRARLYARTAVGLLRYHRWLADTSPGRLTRLCAARDSMMAANLLSTAENAADSTTDNTTDNTADNTAENTTENAVGRGPVLVYAHNGHLQRDRSSMRMGGSLLQWWSAGAIVSAKLGEQYAFLATALGTIRHQGVDAPAPDTVEGLLYALARERCIVDARRLAGVATAARVSPWFGYAPLDPAQVAGTDGVVFVRDVGPRPATGNA